MEGRKLLFFRADGCGVCLLKAPLAQEIARSLELPLELVDLDREEGRRRAAELRIHIVPTLALVEGERVPFRLVGRLITPENVAHLLALTHPPPRES